MIADVWESLTWAIVQAVAWVKDLIMTWWEMSPLTVLGVVITIVLLIIVIIRPID